MTIAHLHDHAAGELHAQMQPAVTRKKTASKKVTTEIMLKTSAWRMNGMSCRMRKNSIVVSPAS